MNADERRFVNQMPHYDNLQESQNRKDGSAEIVSPRSPKIYKLTVNLKSL